MGIKGSAGSVIKVIAIIFLVIGVIASIAASIKLESIEAFFPIVAAAGVSALIFYGFGELIDNTGEMLPALFYAQSMNDQMKKMNKQMEDMESTLKNISSKLEFEKQMEAKKQSEKPIEEEKQLTFNNADVDIPDDRAFFESLKQLDSAGAMLIRLDMKYPSPNSAALKRLIDELREIENLEHTCGKLDLFAHRKIDLFLNGK